MTQVEQLLLKLGVDNSAVAKGMRGAQNTITSSLGDIKRSIAGAFSVGAVIGFFQKTLDHFAEIKDKAENLNVGTDFLQGMGRIAETTNTSAEKLQKGLEKLNIKIGEAKDGGAEAIKTFAKFGITVQQLATMSTEEIFYKIADATKATGDQTINTARTVEVFGKSMGELVSVLNQGGDALRGMVKSAAKLSEEDVKALGQAKDDIKDAWETTLIWGGKALSMVKNVGQAFGTMSATGFGEGLRINAREEALKKLAAEEKAVRARVDAEDAAEKTAAADKAAAIAAEKKADELAEATKQAKLKEEADKKSAKWAEAEAKASREWRNNVTAAMEKGKMLAKSMRESQTGRTDWTLADIAGLSGNELSRDNQWKIGAAQDVLAMRENAKWARLEGNDFAAKDLLNRSDELAKSIGGLSSSEADPLGALREQAMEQTEILKGLGATVESNALRIIVANSE